MKHRAATIAEWQREEDGSYHAELGGFELRVRWHPENPPRRRGFTWEAKQLEGEQRLSPATIYEEPEVAMADAEASIGLAQRTAPAA